ncbi:MAG TPA: tetratricopeptide repeat protein [Chthoniobacterales bacterium]|nr:tetratricopeptide repeat protein [Chthoniobacterales bacterium]
MSGNTVMDTVPETAVREQLARIVDSPKFIPSVRLCRFLTHVVNRTLSRDLNCLKEFSIAMEVFDRTSSYDPNVDAIVRVEARRLRTKLKEYYEGTGRNDPVLIGLRPGSYVPIFRWLDAQPQSSHQETGAAVQAGASIAVLPFVNMSPEPEQDYFCDGISEEIIDSLTRIPGLNVIARSSAFQFKGKSADMREVGRRLSADVIIEGSVRKAAEKLRIAVQAIQAESGHHIWSEVFRRELKDIFAIQEEIAQSVASLLRVHLPLARARVHRSVGGLEAYTRYLRARFLIHQQSPETLRAALEQLRELTHAFPDYHLAYSGMAAACGFLSLFGVVSGRDVYPEAKANAERGYALDPHSGETCTVLGGLRGWFEHRWDEALKLFDHALELQPGHATAHAFRGMALLCQGDIPAAEAALRRSTELDPLSAGDCARLAYLHYVKGNYQSAAEHLERAFELDRDYPEALFYKGLLQLQQQDYDSAVECLRLARLPLEIGLLAAAYARQDNRPKAEKCIEKLHRLAASQYVTPLAEALAAIGLKDFDLALQRLDEAIDHKTNFVNMLAVEPFFHPLRSDHRFTGLLKKLNLAG